MCICLCVWAFMCALAYVCGHSCVRLPMCVGIYIRILPKSMYFCLVGRKNNNLSRRFLPQNAMGAMWGEEKRKFGLHKTKNNDFFYLKSAVRKFREKRRAKREKNSPHSD